MMTGVKLFCGQTIKNQEGLETSSMWSIAIALPSSMDQIMKTKLCPV